LLAQHRRKQMQRLDELMVALDGDRLRVGQRFLEFGGEFVESHGASNFWVSREKSWKTGVVGYVRLRGAISSAPGRPGFDAAQARDAMPDAAGSAAQSVLRCRSTNSS
jgi:hypothetical protein